MSKTNGQSHMPHAQLTTTVPVVRDEISAFRDWYNAVWLGDGESSETIPVQGDKRYDEYLKGYTIALGAWMARAGYFSTAQTQVDSTSNQLAPVNDPTLKPTLDFLKEVVAVAVTMLYDSHKRDVERVFDLQTLGDFVQITEKLGSQQVEDIYKKAWLMLKGARDPWTDADRYQWLRKRLIAGDFDWNESGVCALIFEWPKNAPVSTDCDSTIDQAMTGNGGSA